MTARSGLGMPSCGARKGKVQPKQDICVRRIVASDFDELDLLPIPNPIEMRRIKTMHRYSNTLEFIGIFIYDNLFDRYQLKGVILANLIENQIYIENVFSHCASILQDAWESDGKSVRFIKKRIRFMDG